MKYSINLPFMLIAFIMLTMSISAFAQTSSMQFFRPNHQKGLSVFETDKTDTIPFNGMKLKIGGNFTQDFQALRHQNDATPVLDANGVNMNQLPALIHGFNLAMANLNIDAQLDDGIRMNLTMYLSSRHHPETWVKGGYVQFDKLLFLKSPFVDKVMKSITIKAGDFEIDYGDQHYRRTDGGNAIYNPFIENHIMDAFATEIGGEIYYHPTCGLIVMAGITNGELNPTVLKSSKIDTVTGELNKYAPAFHGKIGYDKQLNKNFRYRITGSFYTVKSTGSNSLYSGDRTGSHYYFVMENTQATADGNFRSGRFTPQFSQQVNAFMINPFIKFRGLELFGTYEIAQGRIITEPELRKATQYAVDLIYRFPCEKENFWVGGRYNSVKASLPLTPDDILINRMAASAGWFITKNIMAKAEYVVQEYKDFTATDIRSGGRFDGFMLQASIGF